MKFLPFLLFPFFVFAQKPSDARWQWGVFAGYENQKLAWQVLNYQPNEPAGAFDERPKAGGSAGVLLARKFSETFSVRLSPGFAYNWNRLHFLTSDGGYFSENYRFADLDLPLHFSLTNPPGRFPLRGSFLFGGRFSQNFFKNEGLAGVKIYSPRFAVDLGIGVLARLRNLEFQPEMVYSFGLNNIHDATETPEIWGIGKMVRDRLAVRILFFLN